VCVAIAALGVAPHVVREIAGHSHIKVTMTVYAHGNLDEHASALARLGAVIDGSLPSTRPLRRAKIVEMGAALRKRRDSNPGASRHARFQGPRNTVQERSRDALPLATRREPASPGLR
jgi:hypothetical protein